MPHTAKLSSTESSCQRVRLAATLALIAIFVTGCSRKPADPPAAAGMALPVQVQPVSMQQVPDSGNYVATIKSRRSATMQPQVDGNITKILVHSGEMVHPGQLLMQIDPLKQVAAVQQQSGAQAQQKAVLQYSQADLDRQKQLYQAGIISKQAYDQAEQAYGNAKGAYDAAAAGTGTQREQLRYYQIRAPFGGMVGDIPVHQGDYVSATTVLTTVDDPAGLEAYIEVPTERSADAHNGLPVTLLDNSGSTLATTSVYFVSPEVDSAMQSILLKAPVPASSHLRNLQVVNARVTWDTRDASTVPVLAVTRIGGQAFVYLVAPNPAGKGYVAHLAPVQVGEPVGNNYPVLGGLKPGDRVITSGLQMLQEGAPVQPLG